MYVMICNGQSGTATPGGVHSADMLTYMLTYLQAYLHTYVHTTPYVRERDRDLRCPHSTRTGPLFLSCAEFSASQRCAYVRTYACMYENGPGTTSQTQQTRARNSAAHGGISGGGGGGALRYIWDAECERRTLPRARMQSNSACFAAAAHRAPRVRRHPRLDDEQRAQVHAADLARRRLPRAANAGQREDEEVAEGHGRSICGRQHCPPPPPNMSASRWWDGVGRGSTHLGATVWSPCAGRPAPQRPHPDRSYTRPVHPRH